MAHYGRFVGGRYFSVPNRYVNPRRFFALAAESRARSSHRRQARVVDDFDAGVILPFYQPLKNLQVMRVRGYYFVDLLDFGCSVPAPHPHGRTTYIGTDILVRVSNVDEDTA